MVEIGFDLRRLPIHLSMVNTSIVDCIGAAAGAAVVVRNPNELDVLVERATNLMSYADLAIVLVVLVVY